MGLEEQPEGLTLLVENKLAPGSGPPTHVPFQQEEALTVVEGQLGYQIPGFVKSVVFPALRAVGSLSGRFERFESGPDSI